MGQLDKGLKLVRKAFKAAGIHAKDEALNILKKQNIALLVVGILSFTLGCSVKSSKSHKTEATALTEQAQALKSALSTGGLKVNGAGLDVLVGPAHGEKWAVDLGDGVKMVFMPIAAGSFDMGSNTGDPDEKPVHRVTLTKSFWMGRTEVTQAQFGKFVREQEYKTYADKTGYAYIRMESYVQEQSGINWSNVFDRNNMPVTIVSWNDAVAYCEWLTERERKAGRLPEGYEYRLSTEAEWEYCCRAPSASSELADTAGDYAGNLDSMAWYEKNSGSKTHPVGKKKANDWGLHDMHGNVWEWCYDWYGNYTSGSESNPQGADSGKYRAFRGGGWYFPATYCRSANRGWSRPDLPYSDHGFRVALAPQL
ncbi:MAG: formylglycine-generating enzyme family protein [Kiritimatiellae bacterium]|jgi:formylglycine-generating enzyme required for sulfatase activity|nr:formylglycine-generating enzyme family protein [Kiritimatiellia bacterium]